MANTLLWKFCVTVIKAFLHVCDQSTARIWWKYTVIFLYAGGAMVSGAPHSPEPASLEPRWENQSPYNSFIR